MMKPITIFRGILLAHALLLLTQALFAGILIGGNGRGLVLHEFAARILVPLAFVQTLAAIATRLRGACPRWVPVASAGLLAAEIVEFAAGHLHHAALHVPLGMAIFGGVLRQVFWAMRVERITETVAQQR
jgi:hypothetical protein